MLAGIQAFHIQKFSRISLGCHFCVFLHDTQFGFPDYNHLSIARKRKLLIKCFTLDGEVGVPIKPVKAAQKSNTYRFKAIFLLWVSAFFAMLCINFIYVKIQVSWALNILCKVRLGYPSVSGFSHFPFFVSVLNYFTFIIQRIQHLMSDVTRKSGPWVSDKV